MRKKEIIENIKNATEEKYWFKAEIEAYIEGYLGALIDTGEIDFSDYIETEAELREWYDND